MASGWFHERFESFVSVTLSLASLKPIPCASGPQQQFPPAQTRTFLPLPSELLLHGIAEIHLGLLPKLTPSQLCCPPRSMAFATARKAIPISLKLLPASWCKTLSCWLLGACGTRSASSERLFLHQRGALRNAALPLAALFIRAECCTPLLMMSLFSACHLFSPLPATFHRQTCLGQKSVLASSAGVARCCQRASRIRLQLQQCRRASACFHLLQMLRARASAQSFSPIRLACSLSAFAACLNQLTNRCCTSPSKCLISSLATVLSPTRLLIAACRS